MTDPNASAPEYGDPAAWPAWTRFWHAPLRAERLALTRVLLGLALLADQLMQYLPNLAHFYGPGGFAPAGLLDDSLLNQWRWTLLLFNTDHVPTVCLVFALWVGATLTWTVGLWTRPSNAAVWFLTMCFHNRYPYVLNAGDRVLAAALFLLLLAPCGRALSVDAWWRRRRGGPGAAAPAFTPAWQVRLLQLQLCMIYASTGLAKLKGEWDRDQEWFKGSWWDGTAVHYALNDIAYNRFSFALLPLPLWLTKAMTYASVWWEALFSLLVLHRWTRWAALLFGVGFHVGILVGMEAGWFSFFMLALYGVWVPDAWWRRRDRARQAA